ncbi:hypothetical protein SAMD00023353_6500610 [Rosellinia necatrix]|uniref:Uncharacterized protein n=1 Tax=Rosellinia necatrix TaxID=77044 RepID=A0A1S8AAV5_ROSNE|nr:hypothetical protein SAMD00023353_6500610 [Rosellinia necatrix]
MESSIRVPEVQILTGDDATSAWFPFQNITVSWMPGWQAAAKMLGLLGSGILSAVGHHLLYQHLKSKPVKTYEDGTPVWATQEWVGRYELVFAFVTKTLLASAVTEAYKQHIWKNFRSQPYTLSAINAMYDATSNILSFATWGFVWNAKVATTLAILTWLLPLTALVTPSTLLVVASNREISRQMHVPTLNLTDTDFHTLDLLPGGGDITPLLTRTTSAAGSGTNIVSMKAVVPNATYSLRFNGPSLKCENASGNTRQLVDDVYAGINSFSDPFRGLGVDLAIYGAFTPDSSHFGPVAPHSLVEC